MLVFTWFSQKELFALRLGLSPNLWPYHRFAEIWLCWTTDEHRCGYYSFHLDFQHLRRWDLREAQLGYGGTQWDSNTWEVEMRKSHALVKFGLHNNNQHQETKDIYEKNPTVLSCLHYVRKRKDNSPLNRKVLSSEHIHPFWLWKSFI